MAELVQVYFEEVGFQTEIREMDWSASVPPAAAAAPISSTRCRTRRSARARWRWVNTFLPTGSPYHGYEDDTIIERANHRQHLDLEERDRLIREAFTYVYEQYADMPLVSLAGEIAVDPQVIAGWTYPGVTSNGFSEWHLIEKAE
jgi:peptide/nickel transport system substrate-binding protein